MTELAAAPATTPALEQATSFADLHLAPEILAAIDAMGYSTPTPIQSQAIPLVLAGRDLLAQAQTGTGKTAAFALPLLHRLRAFANTSTSPARHPVRALVLTPTRELAIQVHESVVDYGQRMPLKSTVVYGGAGMKEQTEALRQGVEILVATPGRLLDHAGSKVVNLSQVQFLVLDEADRMLDMGFLPDLKRILDLLPKTRQTLLFSATFSDDILRLSGQFLHEPQKVEVARRNTAAETVEQIGYRVPEADKLEALLRIVKLRGLTQAIVFTRTKLTADKLGRQLQKRGVSAAIIHGDKAQVERITALDGFKKGEIQLLVATDIAARGLDVVDLPAVFNYELPYHAEDYVHRIGRTGRAGASGLAVSLIGQEEEKLLSGVERFIQRTLSIEDLPEAVRPAAREHRSEYRNEARSEPRSEPRSESRSEASEAPTPPRPVVDSATTVPASAPIADQPDALPNPGYKRGPKAAVCALFMPSPRSES